VIIAGSAASLILKDKIEASSKKIYESRSMLKVLENRDENYSLLKADYPLVQEGLPVLRKALPKDDNLDGVVTSLDALALETDNTQNLVFDPMSAAQIVGGMKSLGFTASLEGNFGSFENYFKKIQRLPYFIEIGNVSIVNSTGVFNNNSRLNYKAKVYIKN
jgi:Tfp pilus assembly protein PilO